MELKLVYYILEVAFAICAIMLPIKLIKKKFSGNNRSIFYGAFVYVLFSAILFSAVNTVATVQFKMDEVLLKSEIAYALVNAGILTVCASLGRLIWVKAVIKNEGEKGDSLLFGMGYSTCFIIFGFVISSVANIIICIMALLGKDSAVSSVFADNISEIAGKDLYAVFLDMLMMVFMAVLEGAVSVVFYRVILSGDKKYWIPAAMLLQLLSNAIVRYYPLARADRIIILLILSIIAAGLAYALLFPFKRKKETE